MEPSAKALTNEEIADKLDEVMHLTKQNNRLLKAIRRDAIIGGIIKMVLWIVLILGSVYYTVQFLQPYLGMLESAGGNGQDYGALFEEYRNLLGQ